MRFYYFLYCWRNIVHAVNLIYFYDLYGTEVSCACMGSQIFQETIKTVEGKGLYYGIRFLALVMYKTQNKRQIAAFTLKLHICKGQGSCVGNTVFLHLAVINLGKRQVPCAVVLRGNFCGPTHSSQLLKMQFWRKIITFSSTVMPAGWHNYNETNQNLQLISLALLFKTIQKTQVSIWNKRNISCLII